MLKQFGLFSCLCITTCVVSAGEVRVYAAPSLANALTDIVKLYQQQHSESKVITVFADPMAMLKQTQQGTNADIYLSTDKTQLPSLSQKKLISKNRAKYLISDQLVAITSVNMDIPFGQSKQFNFAQAFKGNLCTAQLDSSALGVYTKQSLTHLGWLSNIQSRITQHDDTTSILNSVQNGKCDVGITFQTDALTSKKVKMMGFFPSNTHDPIDYYMSLTSQGKTNKTAIQFERFILTNPKVSSLLLNYGFTHKK
ncbi:molybdate ABC transporter substrate-binding protein [Acinetobacter sp. S40]|uniref:molybdate ABC transporter substrate-binding protein n=1 Tax=Acinetobacter sp. S40 TaxID=2767434 RepID=UPI00190C5F99|nr:molybdate ABC transporter substrate-binding protein [Acinetobacter sp. S40]MBJ9985203.1 molybdate ABC transporter substrate-binding protein [Acinetobacter sp. S40]